MNSIGPNGLTHNPPGDRDISAHPQSIPFAQDPEAGVEISFDETAGRSVIATGEQAPPYPDPAEASPALRAILLEPGTDGQLLLPDNYVTLGQALNDASGNAADARGIEVSKMLLTELGHGLGRVALEESQVPVKLGYANVIYSREEKGPKLLPPMEFIAFDTGHTDQARKHVIQSLWKSLEKGATNDAQRRLAAESFSGFIKAFGE